MAPLHLGRAAAGQHDASMCDDQARSMFFKCVSFDVQAIFR